MYFAVKRVVACSRYVLIRTKYRYMVGTSNKKCLLCLTHLHIYKGSSASTGDYETLQLSFGCFCSFIKYKCPRSLLPVGWHGPSQQMAGDSSFDNTGTTVVSRFILGLAIFCVALRFYVRRQFKTGIGWDDRWILIGLMMTCSGIGLVLWGQLSHLASSFSLTIFRRQCGSRR